MQETLSGLACFFFLFFFLWLFATQTVSFGLPSFVVSRLSKHRRARHSEDNCWFKTFYYGTNSFYILPSLLLTAYIRKLGICMVKSLCFCVYFVILVSECELTGQLIFFYSKWNVSVVLIIKRIVFGLYMLHRSMTH